MIQQPQHDLIFDVGMNHGEDSAFYLAKGFRVVAIEANPLLAQDVAKSLGANERLTILNVGVWDAKGDLPFYVNAFSDHWSSFDPRRGKRRGEWKEIKVPCVTFATILARYGVPHYLKIDVEGADEKILAELADVGVRPTFLSVEEFGPDTFNRLARIGYTHAKIVPQKNKPPAKDCSSEGKFVAKQFTGKESGLFGADLPGEWLKIDAAKRLFTETIRDERSYKGPPGEWFDIHATSLGRD